VGTSPGTTFGNDCEKAHTVESLLRATSKTKPLTLARVKGIAMVFLRIAKVWDGYDLAMVMGLDEH
jgi:hypothetical protein